MQIIMSDIPKINNQKSVENNPFSNSNKDKINRPENLIIEDNTVYEIDPDCYEKVKRSRMNQRRS